MREQSRRISRCRLTFFRRSENAEIVTNGAFVRDAILPLYPDAPEQLPLWQERVRLDEGFFQSLIEHPLPIREAAIRQISNRSMAIDLYIWLAYRLHVQRGPVEVSWPALRQSISGGLWGAAVFPPGRPVTAQARPLSTQARVTIDERTGLSSTPPLPPSANGRLLAGSVWFSAHACCEPCLIKANPRAPAWKAGIRANDQASYLVS